VDTAMVPGVRVHGPDKQDVEVKIDETFRSVPVPEKLGVTILYKIQSGTGGDDSNIRSNAIVRFMADTSDGLAPEEWQYGGTRGPAPPVVLARKDQVPFSSHDFEIICEYISHWMEQAGESEGHFTEVTNRILEPSAFQQFVRENIDEHPLAFLSLRFPKDSIVEANGLGKAELNGLQGRVCRYSRDRVGVHFPDRDVTAIRPEKLQLVYDAPIDEPSAKRHMGEPQTKERKQELERQEALQISRRFVECLHEDTFPEMGDLHLFGVGCDYRARATEVLAVWQGLVKHMHFTAERVAEALLEGNLQECFIQWTKELASSSTPNSTYAKKLMEANFAATEWDEL